MKTHSKRLLIAGVAVLLLTSIAAAAPACSTIIGTNIVSGNIVNGTPLTQSGDFCQLGPNVFSNFSVTGFGFPSTPTPFFMAVGLNTTSSTLDFAYTNISAYPGSDFLLTFQITPGVGSIKLLTGPGVTVTELLCNVATGPGGSCSGTVLNTSVLAATNGGSASSSVIVASKDFVYKDVSGGSGFGQTVIPEPMTLSLIGVGLISLRLFGRQRFQK